MRTSWEKTDAIFEFLVPENSKKKLCHTFHVNILGGQNFHFQLNSKIEITPVSNLKIISNR